MQEDPEASDRTKQFVNLYRTEIAGGKDGLSKISEEEYSSNKNNTIPNDGGTSDQKLIGVVNVNGDTNTLGKWGKGKKSKIDPQNLTSKEINLLQTMEVNLSSLF